MELILNGVNGKYLWDIAEKGTEKTESVLAAVAYATNDALRPEMLMGWCLENNIPLTYYGRLSADVAVYTKVLEKFLIRKSPDFVCKLVEKHHAKIIWWRGYGLYIGSANLSDLAWNKNVEAGCFFEEYEITNVMEEQIMELFGILEENATELTEEVLERMEAQDKSIKAPNDDFLNHTSFKRWKGLNVVSTTRGENRRKQIFLDEWYKTLQDLRDIGDRLNSGKYKPSWVDENVPRGAHADQFLHAHYRLRTFEGNRTMYESHFRENKNRKEDALEEAMRWWKELPESEIQYEKATLEKAPRLRDVFSERKLHEMTKEDFNECCYSIHALMDYARRAPNKVVNLPGGKIYTVPIKTDALATVIWDCDGSDGKRLKDMLNYVLYSGNIDDVPERLWDAIFDSKWKMDGIGLSTLGELIGWVLPEKYPPRNDRTSKSLRSLGYDVLVRSG